MENTVSIDKAKFRSTEEYERAMELIYKQNIGEITGLQFQPLYSLLIKFVLRNKNHPAITYKPDFRYIENGKTIVEDLKASEFSEKNTAYQMRKKLFLAKYGEDILFRQILVVNGKQTVTEY